jgi:hypothetical protein
MANSMNVSEKVTNAMMKGRQKFNKAKHAVEKWNEEKKTEFVKEENFGKKVISKII